MSSYDSRFECELGKLISEELERLRRELEIGAAVTDHAKYQNYVGRIASLKKVTDDFCPEVQKMIDKG